MADQFLFQYCQKLVVFSADLSSVLLCKRKGEADYDGVYSFIGGKMEKSDESIIESMTREKNEEIGNCRIKLYPTFSHNILFTKADGNKMILPHYFSVFQEGDVVLSDEYSEYFWVPISDLESFEPVVPNVPGVVSLLQSLQSSVKTLESVTI